MEPTTVDEVKCIILWNNRFIAVESLSRECPNHLNFVKKNKVSVCSHTNFR